MAVEVAVDVSELVNLATQISTVGTKTRAAITSAINRAGDMGATVIKRELAIVTGIRQGDLNLTRVHASPGRPDYELKAKGKAIPLSEFAAKQTAAGVSANAWGKRKVYQGTFLARLKGGHVGVYAHEAGPPEYARRVSPSSGRTYWSQQNIRQLFGPSVPTEMLREPLPAEWERTVRANFLPRLTHELERMLAALDAKSKTVTVPTPQP